MNPYYPKKISNALEVHLVVYGTGPSSQLTGWPASLLCAISPSHFNSIAGFTAAISMKGVKYGRGGGLAARLIDWVDR